MARSFDKNVWHVIRPSPLVFPQAGSSFKPPSWFSWSELKLWPSQAFQASVFPSSSSLARFSSFLARNPVLFQFWRHCSLQNSVLGSVINQLMTCLFLGPISCLERSEYSMRSVQLHDRKWDYIVITRFCFLTIENPESLTETQANT